MLQSVRALRILLVLLTSLAILAASAPAASAQGCQKVYVIDECELYLRVYHIGQTDIVANVDLRDGGSNELTDVAAATLPGYEHDFAFVTQGGYLRVVDTEAESARPVSIKQITGKPELELYGVAASQGLALDSGGTQHALYLVGAEDNVPYLIVMDQELLLAYQESEAALLTVQPLCEEGSTCSGTGFAVAAAPFPLAGEGERAFAALLATDPSGQWRQHFVTIERPASASGPWTTTLDPWNVGASWTVGMHRAMGVAFDREGALALGAFQEEGETGALLSGERSCPIEARPTDLEVWGPSDETAVEHLQIVTAYDQAGDYLDVSRALSCVSGGGFLSRRENLAGRAVGLALSSNDDKDFWVYAASQDADVVRGFRFEVDKVMAHEVLMLNQTLDISLVGCEGEPICPGRVAIGAPDPSVPSCPIFSCCEGECWTAVPIPCCLDEDDPDPRCETCGGGGGGGGGGGDLVPWTR